VLSKSFAAFATPDRINVLLTLSSAAWQEQGLSPHVDPVRLHRVSDLISRTVSVSNASFKLVGPVLFRHLNVHFFSIH
jgi:hypothetical protein